MNAPRPMPAPSAGPPMGAPPAPMGAPPDTGYPAGADVMQEQGAAGMDPQVDNPVIAGFRSIMMLVQKLTENGDPRANPAKEHLIGLLQTLQGAPAESPMPPAAPPPGGPQGAPMGPQMGEAPDMANIPVGGGPAGMSPPPPPPPMPPEGDIPLPSQQSRPLTQMGSNTGVPMGPNAGAKGKVRPMGQKQTTPQAEPVVLR